MNSHSRRLSSTAPVPERPATNSSKSGTQNVFWTSTTSTASRNESSVEGGRSCSSAQAGASRARSSYGTRQTSPTRFGSKCAGSGSSRMVTCQSRRGARPARLRAARLPDARQPSDVGVARRLDQGEVLLEHHLSLERAVHRALRRDLHEALAPVVGHVLWQLDVQPEARR